MSRDGERIQKVLATAGVASRREIEAWVAEGRVEVNGETAKPGQHIRPGDRLRVDGQPLRLPQRQDPQRVLLYKKRTGELVTQDDPEGRRTVFRKLPKLQGGRWIAVGRLDINTSGLLLLTNDGELAHRLMHPRYEMTRKYAVRVHGPVDDAMLRRLRKGVELDDGPAHFDSLVSAQPPSDPEDREGGTANHWFEVQLHEGRNRLVRRLWESQGCEVSRLIRIGFGPVELGRGIRSGSYREMEAEEIVALRQAVGLVAEGGRPRSRAAEKPVRTGPVRRDGSHQGYERASSSRGGAARKSPSAAAKKAAAKKAAGGKRVGASARSGAKGQPKGSIEVLGRRPTTESATRGTKKPSGGAGGLRTGRGGSAATAARKRPRPGTRPKR